MANQQVSVLRKPSRPDPGPSRVSTGVWASPTAAAGRRATGRPFL